MEAEEAALDGADAGSWVVGVDLADGTSLTVRVEWTCFAPPDELVLGVLDRALRNQPTRPAAVTPPPRLAAAGATTITTNGPSVTTDLRRC